MTSSTTPPRALIGQHLGQAAAASRALLDQVLARAGAHFDEWVVLRTLAQSEGSLPVGEATDRLSRALDLSSVESINCCTGQRRANGST